MPEDYLPALKPLLETALKQSPRMIANQLQIAVADAQRIANGVSPLLPGVGGSMQYGVQYSAVSNNPSANAKNKGLFYTAQISQNLFQWGALKNMLEVQKAAEVITEKNYAEGYRVFVTTLRRQYLSLVATKISLRNARFSL
jgi:outer membrane protein TolC